MNWRGTGGMIDASMIVEDSLSWLRLTKKSFRDRQKEWIQCRGWWYDQIIILIYPNIVIFAKKKVCGNGFKSTKNFHQINYMTWQLIKLITISYMNVSIFLNRGICTHADLVFHCSVALVQPCMNTYSFIQKHKGVEGKSLIMEFAWVRKHDLLHSFFHGLALFFR